VSDTSKYIFLKIPAIFLTFLIMSCAHLHNAGPVSAVDNTEGHVARVCAGIYRGARLANLDELESLKVRTILNLEKDTDAVRQEKAGAARLGMEVINIPMSEVTRPRLADLVRAVKIMEDPRFQPVYVHCLHGRDRTGLTVAAYRILHDGWSVERADREAIDHGHAWWFYNLVFRWKKSLRELLPQKPLTATLPGRQALTEQTAG
jgi:protein-tyrosine phosphatase